MNTLTGTQGFNIKNGLYSSQELAKLRNLFLNLAINTSNVRKNSALFAIRHISEIAPTFLKLVLNDQLRQLLAATGQNYRLVKSLYFDKPPNSNWFVFWHQDLTVSVKEKQLTPNFTNWTNKNGFIGVQPPISILEDMLTCRIHLDDCTQENGGLRVIPQSHQEGILSPTQIEKYHQNNTAVSCDVQSGGALFVSPLLLHASSKNSSQQHRRVIHLEFSSLPLPEGLAYREEIAINYH